MKQLKNLRCFIGVVIASAVFASPAAADQLTSPTGTAVTTETTHTLTKNKHVELANSIANIACDYTYHGIINSHGWLPKWEKKEEKWFNCTNSWHVTVTALGELTVEHSAGYNGIIKSNGNKITTTRFGITCNYETNNTFLGTFTGGSPGLIDIEASIPIASGSSGLCGSGNAKMSGTLEVTSPSPLYVDG